MRDKISALAVPPGNSLTDRPKKWAWEQPPQFTDPEEAIDYITDSIEATPAKDDLLKLLFAGITVEELVNQVAFKGFMAGSFTPDVAELIKPAIGIFLYGLAVEEGFEPQMFVDEKADEGALDDETFFQIMKARNPNLFSAMNEEFNRMQRMQMEEATQVADINIEPAGPSFLNVQKDEE